MGTANCSATTPSAQGLVLPGASVSSGKPELLCGDCLEVMALMPSNSVDSVVTDPPYHLTSIVKRFGGANAAPAQHGADGLYARASRGFMGKQWDGGDIAFRAETWAEVLRVLKPGGHLIAFSATRTYHRMACAVEDAGFEIRDMLGWLYGTGFPKSHNLPGGIGTALKPAIEPIVFARKPLVGTVAANVLAYGTGGLNIDACRVGLTEGDDPRLGGAGAWTTTKAQSGDTVSLPRGTVTSSALGRWPANIQHDGSDEVLSVFPHAGGGDKRGACTGRRPGGFGDVGAGAGDSAPNARVYDDSGSAARFFYSPKASKADRAGSKHPTVKPIELMRYYARLITPPGGTVLDPFAGSGTTGAAALAEGFGAILIEREAEYQVDIRRRLGLPEPSVSSGSSAELADCDEGIFA